MKFTNSFICCLIVAFFTGCQSNTMQYPDNLPEAHDIQEYTNDSIVTKMYFDKNGVIFRIANFNLSNESCISPIYGSSEMIVLHEDSSAVMTTYYDTHKQPIVNAELGYARSHMAFNKDHMLIEEAYYNAEGKLIIPTYLSYALQRSEYDNNGNRIKATSYNEKKQVILPINVYSYNADQQNIRVSFVDEKGNLMFNNQHYAYYENKYEGDVLKEYSYHDIKGNLVMVNELEGYEVDGEGDNIPHARGEWIYQAEGDSTTLRLYDMNNQLIKEFVYDYGDEGGYDGYYKEVNDDTFSDNLRVSSMFNYLFKSVLQMKPDGNSFKMLQGWGQLCQTKRTDYSGSFDWMFESDIWEKDDNGKKRSLDEAYAKFSDAAWDLYYVTDYLSGSPAKVQSAFEKVKPIVKLFISKDQFEKSGAALLVSTAMAAYDDIQKKGSQSVLPNIQTVMKISEKPDFYQTADLYEPMKPYISMSLTDIKSSLSEEEKKEVIVWAYSFWLRRNNEKSTVIAYQLLEAVKEMYI